MPTIEEWNRLEDALYDAIFRAQFVVPMHQVVTMKDGKSITRYERADGLHAE